MLDNVYGRRWTASGPWLPGEPELNTNKQNTLYPLITWLTQGIQRRMVLVVNVFDFLKLLCVLSCCLIRPSARCGRYT